MAKIGPDKIIFIFIFILNCFLLIDDNHFGYKQKKNPNINLKTKHCNSGRRCRRLLSPFPARLVRASVQPSSSRSSRAEEALMTTSQTRKPTLSSSSASLSPSSCKPSLLLLRLLQSVPLSSSSSSCCCISSIALLTPNRSAAVYHHRWRLFVSYDASICNTAAALKRKTWALGIGNWKLLLFLLWLVLFFVLLLLPALVSDRRGACFWLFSFVFWWSSSSSCLVLSAACFSCSRSLDHDAQSKAHLLILRCGFSEERYWRRMPCSTCQIHCL